MMFVTYGDMDVLAWHVGEKTPPMETTNGSVIQSAQANGDELRFILDHFGNLPSRHHNKVVVWYGEMAQFIVGNLKEVK